MNSIWTEEVLAPYNAIIAALGYVISPDHRKTLMVHRNARSHDHHFGKYTGMGGKMHPDESIYTCITREINEEAGIECEDVVLRGTVNWPDFGPRGENWFGFVFRIDSFRGVPYSANNEGVLSWQEIDKLAELKMWEGDHLFLPYVFDDHPGLFYGYMRYQDNELVDHHFERT